MSLTEPTTSLTTCQRCEMGMLELESGTDPDKAKEQEQWSESYRCNHCGAMGRYEVDETGNTIDESFYGACKSYE